MGTAQHILKWFERYAGATISTPPPFAMRSSELLNRVKDLYPDTIRIILSGYADPVALIDAINRGAIYRFFIKPWEDEPLRSDVREAFQHQWLIHGAPAAQLHAEME